MNAETPFTGPFPDLRSERLLLRELRSDDAGPLFRQFSDEEVTRYYDLDTFTQPTQAEELVALDADGELLVVPRVHERLHLRARRVVPPAGRSARARHVARRGPAADPLRNTRRSR